jgi:4-hydroxy-tetrahydrodipicolinate synthase
VNDDSDFDGVLPALVTPFTADGSRVNEAALADVVEHAVQGGVTGLVPCGSTGEFTCLTDAERRLVVEKTIEAAAGRVPVVPHTGALSTRQTVDLSVHAEEAGAAAVMIVPPFYEALSWEELLAHFGAVAERISIPIMFYNLPSATGTSLTVEQFQELDRAGVRMLKDTGGDAVLATELIQRDSEGPTLLNGWDTLTVSAMAAGARAVVWGVANMLPAQCVELHRRLATDADLVGARQLWARIWPVCRFVEAHRYPAAEKAACELVGLRVGPTRAPLLPLATDDRNELGRLLAEAGAATAAELTQPA